ncbi:MAG: mono/diheme cytochrome c family protein [Thermoproteota archaeon]
MKFLIAILTLFFSFHTFAVDWSAEAKLPNAVNGFSEFNRANIYKLNSSSLQTTIINGYKHALLYPVKVTELLIPFKPIKNFFEVRPNNPLRRLIFRIGHGLSPFKSLQDLFKDIGLIQYPEADDQMSPSPIPQMIPAITQYPMGTSMQARLYQDKEAIGFTFSCAACHTADLFGKKIMGMTNRFPGANEFFKSGKTVAPFVNSQAFRLALGTTKAEYKMFKSTKQALRWVGITKPLAKGLDTSLAQVALSLAKRGKGPYAIKHNKPQRRNPLSKKIADSKPAVWWNVKYKTRWLSDGSIVSGNPVHTNFLWNEIGRGVDLKKLETWLDNNKEKVKELTAAVFATKAPLYTDFFPAKNIDINAAKRGEKIYNNSCVGCHGIYKKNWSKPNASELTYKEQLITDKVMYHEKTPVINVGTSPNRHQGMKYFNKDLNRLKISKSIGTVVVTQKGYVPPPLVGIWARWPYFHNNSIANLCELLSAPDKRVTSFWMGEALDKTTDFDDECNGYPLGENTPAAWSKQGREYFYNTKLDGLSNQGHFRMMLNSDDSEKYSRDEKLDLIQYLKTL